MLASSMPSEVAGRYLGGWQHPVATHGRQFSDRMEFETKAVGQNVILVCCEPDGNPNGLRLRPASSEASWRAVQVFMFSADQAALVVKV